MKYLVPLFICISTSFSGIVPESVKFSSEDARVRPRRDGVSYSSNVVHQNPKNPDQRAESSIKVDFHSNHQARNLARKRPKTDQPSFVSQNVDGRHQQDNRQSQSQSFNVGYSVRFNGKSQNAPQKTYQTPEIITGSRNEAVQQPNSNFEAQEFVNNALIDIKKQKISGIKPKYHKYVVKDDSKHFISNLAPKTQQYLSYLGDAKPIESSNPRFRQQLLPKIAPTTESLTSSWTSVSPTVDIYHSKDLLQTDLKQSTRHFDHVGALGKSQGFDYSNVMDALNAQHQDLYDELKTTDQTLIPFAEKSKSSYKPFHIVPIQLSQTPSESIQSHNFHKHNLPVDTSLLRDPVLTVPNKNVAVDQHTLPIAFDTTLLQAMQHKLNTNQDINKEHNQLLQSGGHVGNVQMHHVHFNRNPQSALLLNKENFDEYFSKYLETVQPQETRVENLVVPFQGINFNSRANAAKNIEMDLRPPPIEVNRSSRLFLG